MSDAYLRNIDSLLFSLDRIRGQRIYIKSGQLLSVPVMSLATNLKIAYTQTGAKNISTEGFILTKSKLFDSLGNFWR